MVYTPSFNLHHHGYHSPKTHIHFTDTHTIYPRLHHIHNTSIMIIVNFVQHNHHTILRRQLRFLFFDFVLYELIL